MEVAVEGLVSVVIPTYNSVGTIINCLQSVLCQSYHKIEVIVVDDGSTDDTFELLENYVSDNSLTNIVLFKQLNQGPSAARNKAVSLASGEYIAFLDSDDCWHPDKIREQVALFENGKDEVILIGTGYSIGITNSTGMCASHTLTIISLNKLLYGNCFITSSVMCRSIVFEKLLFSQNQKYSEDYRLWLQIAALGYMSLVYSRKLTFMADKPLYGAKGLSSNLWKMEKGELANYYFLFAENKISFMRYIIASCFSFIKYMRRCIYSFVRL
jgi:glycosyltransferase involved in cell wall biosynthesis